MKEYLAICNKPHRNKTKNSQAWTTLKRIYNVLYFILNLNWQQDSIAKRKSILLQCKAFDVPAVCSLLLEAGKKDGRGGWKTTHYSWSSFSDLPPQPKINSIFTGWDLPPGLGNGVTWTRLQNTSIYSYKLASKAAALITQYFCHSSPFLFSTILEGAV